MGEVGTDVSHASDIGDELGEIQRLVRAGLCRLDLGTGTVAARNHRMLVANGAGAGTGRGDNVVNRGICKSISVGV